ncbi:hypothetical protein [Bacillus sp. X1(2014)]|uniref:hypothetical protein n=1 Tax=Bacillus sp. X1(2014) TaxID=1565991 RepID=UPI0011A2DDC6|nr:hypothetical protein [Bacillus sp. X1(2014)]
MLNVINAYPHAEMWEKAGVFKLKKLTHTRWYLICVGFAIVIYGYQHMIEKSIRKGFNPIAESGKINFK